MIQLDSSSSEQNSNISAPEETKNSTANDNFKNSSENLSSSNKVGESEDSEKSDYIKVIFEITKVDRQNKKEVKLTKHRHIISHCEHTYAKYYAKGMCKKCYFSRGQTK